MKGGNIYAENFEGFVYRRGAQFQLVDLEHLPGRSQLFSKPTRLLPRVGMGTVTIREGIIVPMRRRATIRIAGINPIRIGSTIRLTIGFDPTLTRIITIPLCRRLIPITPVGRPAKNAISGKRGTEVPGWPWRSPGLISRPPGSGRPPGLGNRIRRPVR